MRRVGQAELAYHNNNPRSKDIMKIGIGQITSTSNLVANGSKAAALIEKAHHAGCKVLFLPEASDYIAGSPEETVSLAQPIHSSPFFQVLKQALLKWPLDVSVGVHEPTEPPSNRVRNTLLYVNSQGEIINRYQKLHLFDADVPNGPILRESRSVEPGKKFPTLIDINSGNSEEAFKIGPQICYDIRFPETSFRLTELGANILLFPAAFTVKTGHAHWSLLNRTRALDNQSFVISAAQVGQHDEDGKRQSYGHSIVIDPWGTVLVEDFNSEGGTLSIADLDFSKLKEVRGNMPLMEQRKGVPTK